MKFDLTVEKACYETAPAKSVTLTNNTSYDAEVTTLTRKLEPTENEDRYDFTRKSDGSYKLTVKECVTAIPANEFSASTDDTSPIIEWLIGLASGKTITSALTEIELPSTLRTIGNFAFINNQEVTGTLTIPRNVETIGLGAFKSVGLGNVNVQPPSAIASSRAPAIAFESGSKLRTIAQSAFEYSGSKVPLLTLPDGLETIEVDAFRYFVMPPSPLVIPASVRKIGSGAFRSVSGINGVTIRSTNLTKDAADPPLGNNLFGGGAGTRLSTITTIKLPLAVYNSYTRAERTAIFGSEVTAYQDLEGNPHP